MAPDKIVSVENLKFQGRHWQLEAVSLLDNTDRLNNSVIRHRYLSFSSRVFQSNILFAKNLEAGQGLFLLKEAPSPMAQLRYSGADYIADYGAFRMIGLELSN